MLLKRLGYRGFHEIFDKYIIKNNMNTASIRHLGEYFQTSERLFLDHFHEH